jgi:imidazolonepropionase-like amidohydrolase
MLPTPLALPFLLALAAPAGDPPVAITGARVVDGTGAPPRVATVLIRGQRIAAVGAGVEVPANATVVDARGKTLLPGMIDTHGHCYSADGKTQYEAWPRLYLAGGVTTVFSPGESDPDGAIALREKIARGEEAGPRLFTAGPYFEHLPADFTWMQGFESVAGAKEHLAKWIDRIDGVKLSLKVTEAEAAAVIEGAHAKGKKVTGHLHSVTATRAVELGIDRLEHGLFAMSEFAPQSFTNFAEFADRFAVIGALDLRSEPVQKLVGMLVEKKVALSATTASFEAYQPDWVPVCAEWEKYFEPGSRRIHKGALARRAQLPKETAAKLRAGVSKQLEFLKLVHDRGGIVVTGTDPGGRLLLPGWGLHREMALLVQAGFTPLAAITAATLHAAQALGEGKDLGSIEPGKLADLVLVDGDPSTDIAAVGNTVAVWQGGRRHDPVALRKEAEGKTR